MALAAFTLFVPQFFFVPLMQGAMNRRTGARVQLIRQLSVSVIEGTPASGADAPTTNASSKYSPSTWESSASSSQ